MYLDGHKIVSGIMDVPRQNIYFNGTVVIGQEQDTLGGGFVLTEMFRGQMAQYNIWDKQIQQQQIREMANCQNDYQGNILSMEIHDGILVNVTTWNEDLNSLCQDAIPFIIIPINSQFQQAKDFCPKIGSVLYAPSSSWEQQLLFNKSKPFFQHCTYSLWLGITDELEEGVWRNLETNEVSPNYFTSNANNKPGINCATLQRTNGLWYVLDCLTTISRCLSCAVRKNHKYLILRGLCFQYSDKRRFEILNTGNITPIFHGLYGYIIYFTNGGTWKLLDTQKNESVAHLRVVSSDVYPLGLHSWQIDSSICEYHKGETIQLGLSVCTDDQFMCNNGECIPILSRCDAHDDCVDQSDEDNCDTVIIPQSYRHQKIPKNETKGKPLVLNVHIDVLRFLHIEDTKNAFSVEFYVNLYWQDQRLRYVSQVHVL
ncbi:MAG: lectin-like protein [Marinicella pacifica]